MTSYIQKILVYRSICFVLYFIWFFAYYMWYQGPYIAEGLSSALVIISDGKSLSELHKLFYKIPSWGGEKGLNQAIFYMKKLTTQYFFIIYVFELAKARELINIMVPKGFRNVDDYEFAVLFNGVLIIVKFFIGVLLFRYFVIPNPIPLAFLTCVIIYTLIINGIFFFGMRSNEELNLSQD